MTANTSSTCWRSIRRRRRYLATKLARRFVADEPPAALVDARGRTLPADRRRHSRSGADDCDVAGVLRRRGATAPRSRARFEFVVSAVRVTGFDATSAMPLVQAMRDLGMPLYGAQPPTGYSDKAEAWVNSGALSNRMNFALALSGGRLRATPEDARPHRRERTGRRRTAGSADDVSAHSWRRRSRTTSPNPPARRRRKRPRSRRPSR